MLICTRTVLSPPDRMVSRHIASSSSKVSVFAIAYLAIRLRIRKNAIISTITAGISGNVTLFNTSILGLLDPLHPDERGVSEGHY